MSRVITYQGDYLGITMPATTYWDNPDGHHPAFGLPDVAFGATPRTNSTTFVPIGWPAVAGTAPEVAYFKPWAPTEYDERWYAEKQLQRPPGASSASYIAIVEYQTSTILVDGTVRVTLSTGPTIDVVCLGNAPPILAPWRQSGTSPFNIPDGALVSFSMKVNSPGTIYLRSFALRWAPPPP